MVCYRIFWISFYAKGNGTDSISYVMGFYQIRTEIRITLTTELSELSLEKNELSIFPNPSQSQINFDQINTIKSEMYWITDLKGRVLLSGVIQENQLDISNPLM